jgi:hypothetical protein
MSHAAAAVEVMDENIDAFEKEHGGKPKGILLGTEIFKELVRQGRIKEEQVVARLTTARIGQSPWTIEAGTWPILDKTIFAHVTVNDWGCFLPPSL